MYNSLKASVQTAGGIIEADQGNHYGKWIEYKEPVELESNGGIKMSKIIPNLKADLIHSNSKIGINQQSRK